MRIWSFLLLSAMTTGCDRGSPVNESVTPDQIERLSIPQNLVVDISDTAQLTPLSMADIGSEGIDAGCIFARNRRILLFASRTDAIARVDGRLYHFVQSGPVDETGGFFEDRQISISVGRAADSDEARITVTNRRTEVQREWRGAWRCGGRG